MANTPDTEPLNFPEPTECFDRRMTDMAAPTSNAFANQWPELWRQLSALNPAARPERDTDGSIINLLLTDTTRLYASDAQTVAAEQIAAWRNDPNRIAFSDPGHCNISPVSEILREELVAWLGHQDLLEHLSPAPLRDAGFLFVFGVGLGYHLPDLIAETSARIIVLIEPVAEFARMALECVDWAALLDVAERRGIQIQWIVDESPDAIVAAMDSILVRTGNTFLDGSAQYRHYSSWSLNTASERLAERLPNFYLSRGFFEDELEAIRNCHAILASRSVRMISDVKAADLDTPLFLVGSGPSLDRDLAHIAQWRDHAMIISCGTALRVLLRNGIRPDFHCEVERVPAAPALLGEVADEYPFDGITLIAASTAHPQICALFKNIWLFYRAALSPARLLNPHIKPLGNADPLVTNAALDAAGALGFRQVYLFGCDLAQADTGSHHSRDSAYYDADKAHLGTEFRESATRDVPGNFGGTVKTLWAYDFARRSLTISARRHGISLVNCSGGARIDGATPRAAAALHFAQALPDRRQITAFHLAARLPYMPAGKAVAASRMAGFADRCEKAHAKLADLEARIASAAGFWHASAEVNAFIGENAQTLPGFIDVARASMMSMLRLGAFFGTRLPDGPARTAFQREFARLFRLRCDAMADQAHAVFASAAQGHVGYLPAGTDAPKPPNPES